MSDAPLELRKGPHRLVLLPETGGAIGQWQRHGRDILAPVANPALHAQKGKAVGAYPLVPYSNRIAGGHFSFEGQEFQLVPNMDGMSHPIHGNGWENAWRVAHCEKSHAVLVFDHTPQGETEAERRHDPHWPFAYRAVLSYALHMTGLEISMVVENRDEVTQPIGFGFHPFFAAGAEATLSFGAESVWLNTADGLPVEKVPCEGEWSFRQPTALRGRVIDNVFAGFGGKAVLEDKAARYAVQIEADPIFGHMVVFATSEGSFVALEPVTNMTDAINRPDEPHRGLYSVRPHHRLGGRICLDVQDL